MRRRPPISRRSRRAAHQAGAPRRALAYALQFETTLRQWDVIGQWVPLSDPRPSAIIDHGEKWIGPTWAHIDAHLILRLVHTKTEETSEAAGTYDLSACPMVVAELASVPADKRSGPLIINERTGLPYRLRAVQGSLEGRFQAGGLAHEDVESGFARRRYHRRWNRRGFDRGSPQGGRPHDQTDDCHDL